MSTPNIRGKRKQPKAAPEQIPTEKVRRLIVEEIERIERSERRVLMAQLVLSFLLVIALAGTATVALVALIGHVKAGEASDALSLAQALATVVFGGLVAWLVRLLNWLWRRSGELIAARDARARLKGYVCLCEREELLTFLQPAERGSHDRVGDAPVATTAPAPATQAAA